MDKIKESALEIAVNLIVAFAVVSTMVKVAI